ncbi:flavin reductase family protein [Streptomyces fungicidicus]|uniref:Flavin reductase n=2 Tax=Streptomyces TaxID=1883 RepID=A0A494UXJ7_9ACTN|nr:MULTISPECIES: flavin reductase family protein [Streptomyces]AYL39250.1 flavin reductase [Streptomyces fungicidicus]EFL38503.1 flavin reductase [Streptomyces griseoflavus Tu4000]QKW03188.1 flavin reductase family protein [Streptomyces sp. NA02536]TQL19567.1 flavin reductase (DIM6/NTAB) family NADH-FMN oxidoreductase RutF [Streptomyces sp. SLBN-134]
MTSTPTSQQAPLVSARQFRDAMAELASPVTVVTVPDGTGGRRGCTASSVTSLSLDPPLLQVAVAHTSSCHQALVESEEFVVHVLADRHRWLADRFARQNIDRFAGSGFTTWPGTDLPWFPDATAAFRCLTRQAIPVGDHTLLVGALSAVRRGPSHDTPSDALLWYRRAFHTLT